jgi:leucyl/phenylalanyl-tRNA---protein transferase
MTNIRWIGPDDGPDALPDGAAALAHPNGLLAAGGSLEPDWLLAAYRRGIFPWYEDGQPILWWCPNPRAVLLPDELHVARSLRRTLRARRYVVTADRAFAAVVDACAAPRRYTDATWITAEMAAAYKQMHTLGWAHSFETWHEGRLAGGVYGISIGRVFFGESMFARERDASKVALARAVEFLRARGCALIDCQLPSSHVTSLGARTMPRDAFLQQLAMLCEPPGRPGPWAEAMGER